MDALMEYTEELLEERFLAVEMECRLRPLSAVVREEGVERIDFLKIDVQKAELDVLRGIEDGDWPRIRQIAMEVHDLDGRLGEVTRLLERRGFRVAVEQDEAVEGSILYNLFALNPDAPPRERDPLRPRAADGVADGAPRSVVFLFPGVGEQYPGMARGLYDAEPVFRAEVDRCAALLRPHLGLDVREPLFAADRGAAPSGPGGGGLDLRRMLGREPASGAAGRLSRTEAAQPAAFVVGWALARLWESWGVRPDALLGHSLGEYTAACVAGVFGLEDALELVALRALAIQALPGGAMLAVPLAPGALAPWLGDGVALAAANAPELCVLSGTEEAIARAERGLARQGHVVRRLAATHAFHSPLMRPVAERVARLAAGMRLEAPRIPMLSNVTGGWLTAAEATDPGYWARHLTGTVRFADGVAELLAEPGRVLVEMGPGGSLGAFVRQQAAASGVPAPHGVASLPHAADDTPEPAFVLEALGRLRTAGVRPDRSAPGDGGRHFPLPLRGAPAAPCARPGGRGGRRGRDRAGAGRRLARAAGGGAAPRRRLLFAGRTLPGCDAADRPGARALRGGDAAADAVQDPHPRRDGPLDRRRRREGRVTASYPLTPLQHGMLFQSLRAPGSGVNVEQVVAALREAVDAERLERAWTRVVRRHDILRTRFRWDDVAEPVQEVLRRGRSWSSPATTTPVVPAEARRRGWTPGWRRTAPAASRWTRRPRCAWRSFARAADEHVLVWTFHHLVMDGRSLALLLREAFALYDGEGRRRGGPSAPRLRGARGLAARPRPGRRRGVLDGALRGLEAPAPVRGMRSTPRDPRRSRAPDRRVLHLGPRPTPRCAPSSASTG